MEKQRTLVSLDQIETGNELKISIQQLFDKVKDIDPNAYRLLADKIKDSDLSPELYDIIFSKSIYDDTEIKNRIESLEGLKANRSELKDYRRKDEDILESDLEQELQDKINVLYEKGYDDRWVREAIEILKATKLNIYDADLFRKITDRITIDDLDHETQSLLSLIANVETDITYLLENTVNKDYLIENYRRKAIDINYEDLSDELQAYFDNTAELDSFTRKELEKIAIAIVNLKESKADIALVNTKADKRYVDETFRRLDTSIGMTDLSQEIIDILDTIEPGFDSSSVEKAIEELKLTKADKKYLDNFLRKTEPISENDLDYRLVEKINRAVDKYDDTDILSHIKNLQSQKVDMRELEYYRRKVDPIQMVDLHDDLKLILNSCVDSELELKSIIATLRYLQDNKLDITYAEEAYRKRGEIILSNEIDPELHNYISSIEQENRELRSYVEQLEYRLRITELEIEGIKNKIGMN